MLKEFSNPLEENYDITSSMHGDDSISTRSNPYLDELLNMVGILEDGEWLGYGITEDEYLHPTKETVAKVRAYLDKYATVNKSNDGKEL